MKKSEEATISEGNNGVDRISQLPDDVLHRILSGLESTEEVFRTTILSKRWNGLWTSVPKIDIDYFRGLEPLQISDLNKSAKFIDTVLANRSVDLESFRLCCLNFYDMATIGRWIHAALTRNVKRMELLFYSKDESEHFKDVKLLECPVNCESLKELRLYLFGYPLKLPYFAEFQAVTVLVLTQVYLSYNGSSDCFTQLNNLEDLSLIDCYMKGSKSASCPNLKNLSIVSRNYNSYYSGDIRIHCPKLVSFEFTGQVAYDVFVDNPNPLKKAVIQPDYLMEDVPYVDLFANISGVESLSIGLYFLFQFINKGKIIPPLPNLKNLEITTTIDSFTMDVLRQFLIHPNLDSIHLIIQQTTLGLEYWNLEETETLRTLTRHLKRVEFDGFNGKNPQQTVRVVTRHHPKRGEFDGFGEDSKLEIARYLLEHGSKLEEMVFKWNNNSNYQEMSIKTMKKVSNFYKSSSTVKVISLFKE